MAISKQGLKPKKIFGKLKEAAVGVKGGWRIYSSGPGIYMNQLISNVLGIRTFVDHVELDPVLPAELAGLTLTYRLFDRPVEIVYHSASTPKVLINGEEISTEFAENRYVKVRLS